MLREAVRQNPWARLRWLSLGLGTVLVYGFLGYMLLEGWSFVDAVYMTLITLTSVGFREVRPLDTSGKLFTVSLIIMGVTLLVLTLSMTAAAIAEGGLGGRSRRRRMQRRIDHMKDHFVVCAYGRVGRTAARELEAEGAKFVVVEKDEHLEHLMIQDGVTYIVGDPTSEPVLKAAGIERARRLLCAVDSDADNVFITLVARSLNPKIFVVARAAVTTSADRLYRAGADRVVSPYVSSGRHMAMVALRPRVVDYLEVETREASMRLEELQIDQGSKLEGRRLSEIAGKTLPLAIRRRNGELIPNPQPDERLQGGDLLVLLGERDDLRVFESD